VNFKVGGLLLDGKSKAAPGGDGYRRRRERPPFAGLNYLLGSGGNAGHRMPSRTFPVSLVVAGPRAGGNAGLRLPMLTFPLSEMTVGISRTSILFIGMLRV